MRLLAEKIIWYTNSQYVLTTGVLNHCVRSNGISKVGMKAAGSNKELSRLNRLEGLRVNPTKDAIEELSCPTTEMVKFWGGDLSVPP